MLTSFIRKYYSKNLNWYIQTDFGKEPAEYLKSFIDHLPIKKGQVLDMGCGPGITIAYLAQLFPLVYFTGIDITEEFIDYARQRNTLPNAEFILGDITKKLPFKKHSLDGIIASFSLIHVLKKDMPLVFNEIATKLKPNAPFYASFQIGESSEANTGTEADPLIMNIVTEKEIEKLFQENDMKIISKHQREPYVDRGEKCYKKGFYIALSRQDLS